MLSLLVVASAVLPPPEVPPIRISTLAGAPSQVVSSLKVSCGGNSYSFKFTTSVSEKDVSIEFDRTPVKPSDELSTVVVEAFRQFADIPVLEAWCPAPSTDGAVPLWLEATGSLKAGNKEPSENCAKRGGIFDDRTLRRLVIEEDAVHIDGYEIGKCTTKEDIDHYNRMTKGSVK